MQAAPFATGARLSGVQAAFICKLARERGGLSIAPEKIAFLEQRLNRRLRATGIGDFGAYINSLQDKRTGADQEIGALVEALTTHTTSFFREPTQFGWLDLAGLPALAALGCGIERPLSVWSAACSTGAEAWTAAMVLDRFSARQTRPIRWNVIGTDISAPVVERARRAVYAEAEIAGLPEDFRKAYLLRSRKVEGKAPLFRIAPEIRKRAVFHQINLVEQGQLPDGWVDVAFLRNVLIYFDAAGRREAIRNVLSRLRTDGFLLTGHSESLNPVPPDLLQVGPSIYRKLR